MKKVLVLGGVSYDSLIHVEQFPQERGTFFPRSFYETIGGTGSGKALNLSKLGFKTTLHTILGNDFYGKQIIDFYKNTDINLVYDKIENTERHTNIMANNGDRISFYTVPPQYNVSLNMEKLEEQVFDNDLIILNIINYTRQLIPIIKKHKKEIWTDLHDYDGNNPYHRDFLEASDYLFFSSEKLANYHEFMLNTIKQNKKLIVCTHGKNGASAIIDNEMVNIPALNVDVVDTNGAGDSFFAGFLYGFTHGRDKLECMRLGNITASLSITSKELVNDLLSEEYLKQLYNQIY